jgi:hypothetical protein
MASRLGKDNGMCTRSHYSATVVSITGHVSPCPLASLNPKDFLWNSDLLLQGGGKIVRCIYFQTVITQMPEFLKIKCGLQRGLPGSSAEILNHSVYEYK